jgi:derlin-1
MSDFSTWYNTVPRFTRYWLTATVAISVAEKIGLISRFYLMLNWTFVISQLHVSFKKLINYYGQQLTLNSLQIWRPLTALFFYPTSFHFLMNCFFLYNYSSRLEKDHYLGSPGDFIYMLIFNWVCCLVVSLFTALPVSFLRLY